ncbi:MAG: hypothetical protein ACFCUJ_06560 [Thiotrichales bacterium]
MFSFRIRAVIVIFCLLAPLFWVIFDSDGQRTLDLLFLRIKGNPNIELHLGKLTPTVSEAEMRQVIPKLKLTCLEQESEFGQRVCRGDIAGFNGLPAQHAHLYYTNDRLTALKINYQRHYHPALIKQLKVFFGDPESIQNGQHEVLRWTGQNSITLMPGPTLEADEEPAMLWLGVIPPT